MVQAYVLVQTEVGKAAGVAEDIRAIPGWVSTDFVTGPYDLIVKVGAQDAEDLGQLIYTRVQAVPGITRTVTCTVVHV
ncbi:MAG: AsnC family transcriptional regulator [Micrococcales bacterium]|nr:MAG: AsnC family transcriptional regulator [Micrococcales bacterium]PIE26790.1 MAG: AsnC family transcriptional regulator [Micrococcales bacterium]